MTAQPLLDVHDITVEFATRRGIVKAVQHVNISVAKGETLGIVGESGSGKSVTSYAVMRILDRAGKIAEGSVVFSGIDVKGASEDQMRDLRGREISMIFQNPRAALNPIRKVGDQIEDVLRQHVQQSQVGDRGEKAIEALEQVKIARARERYHAYPFELSGGMCQRVVIALALACNPQLLIADEPTTGLDVTTQKAVMDLIVELTKRRGMSTILITHDLGLAAAYCDRVVVMEKGRVVETALSADIFAKPEHAYTKKLMRATPRLGVPLRDPLPEEAAAARPTVTRSAASCPTLSRGCRCARASRWCFRIRPIASIRALPPPAPSSTRSCNSAISGDATRCAPAARNWRAWSACRSTCSIVSPINCWAARKPPFVSRGASRCPPNWSFSTSRPLRSTSRCRRWC